MTLIEIKPHRWGWKAFEAPGVDPVFPKKDHAIDYAQSRASFRTGEIRVLDSTGKLERTIAFSEADRKLFAALNRFTHCCRSQQFSVRRTKEER